MNLNYINPFVLSTHNVFETMLQIELTRGELSLSDRFQSQHEVSGGSTHSQAQEAPPVSAARERTGPAIVNGVRNMSRETQAKTRGASRGRSVHL